MKIKTLLISFCFLLAGCNKNGQVEFIDLTLDHKNLTTETNSAVIASIEDDLRSRPDLSPEDIKSVQGLINRLKLITKQSEVIYQYLSVNEVNNEIMSQLIQNRSKKWDF